MESMYVATLRAGHEAFSAHDCARAAAIVTGSNVKFVDHGRGITVDIRIVDAQYIDAGKWVTARFCAVGVQDGPIAAGFPASHKPFVLDVCEVWHFGPDGKADEGHNDSDSLGYMMQLGHLALPG